MKKALPYLLLAIILVAAGLLIFTGNNEQKRALDDRLSFRTKDKIPYGSFVAYENLKHVFDKATVSVNSNNPGNWDSLSFYDSRQALIIVSPWFWADEFEMKKLIRFAEAGNDVFVSTAVVSEDARTVMNCGISYIDAYDILSGRTKSDTLKVQLTRPPFASAASYEYPGKRFDTYFFRLDSSITTTLGAGRDGETNFIHLKAGKGNLYFHLAPMAFTNYFLLKGDNIRYYENVLSVIPRNTKTVVWDEYYLGKRYMTEPDNDGNQRKGWLATLWGYREFRWALSAILIVLLLFVLLEMRRKQRYIPIINKPRNDSMDFVKTIGRLYFDKGDHMNLCRKMAAYFLEHVRNRYKLPTGELNDTFIKNLQFKTGADEADLQGIVFFIRDLDHATAVSAQQLAHFHKQLENFYSKS